MINLALARSLWMEAIPARKGTARHLAFEDFRYGASHLAMLETQAVPNRFDGSQDHVGRETDGHFGDHRHDRKPLLCGFCDLIQDATSEKTTWSADEHESRCRVG